MFVADALGYPATDKMEIHFIDNTDPDGIARELARLGGPLGETLVLVICKSGGTPETRNGMLLVAAAYRKAGLDFGKHAVAITGSGSHLDQQAVEAGLAGALPDVRLGRRPDQRAVGRRPGPRRCKASTLTPCWPGGCLDEATAQHDTRKNPAALLALMWYHATGGKGQKDMVVLPYKDRLLLFCRYLQQLVMESLGKRLDLEGKRVDQGIASTATRAPPISTPTSSSSATASTTSSSPSSACWRTAERRCEVEPGPRRAISSTASCWERARRCSRTTGNR